MEQIDDLQNRNAELFLIPMRGNEVEQIDDLQNRNAELFLIPMRGRFISCDSFGFMGNSAGGLLKVHWREISEC